MIPRLTVLTTSPEPSVSIPKPVYNPPFNVTRASHAVLTVKDLAKSRAFYVDLIGFIVSDEDKDTIYLRGVAEPAAQLHERAVIVMTITATKKAKVSKVALASRVGRGNKRPSLYISRHKWE
jgi:hypothetical protein